MHEHISSSNTPPPTRSVAARRHQYGVRCIVDKRAQGVRELAVGRICDERFVVPAGERQHLQSQHLVGEARLAVAQVVVPRADKRVVEAERTNDLRAGGIVGKGRINTRTYEGEWLVDRSKRVSECAISASPLRSRKRLVSNSSMVTMHTHAFQQRV